MGRQRGRLNSKQERLAILELIQEASCELLGITPKTIQRWKNLNLLEDKRNSRTGAPHNKLTSEEVGAVLEIVNKDKYASLSPAKIVPLLADEGRYIASESTIYRILKASKMMTHRQKSKPRFVFKPKSVVAKGPNQVYNWDITYLPSTVKGLFFYLYCIMDIYSRKIVGWQVYVEESSQNAADLIEATCNAEGIQKNQVILHSDNGSPMKGATMIVTLQRLGVMPSFSRPLVSNDNPFSESLFKTAKYCPLYPEKPFQNLSESREWGIKFVNWYNYKHFHSGIKFVTPYQRHQGLGGELLANRHLVYQDAQKRHPNRWTKKTRDWSEIKEVFLNPDRFKSSSNKAHVNT